MKYINKNKIEEVMVDFVDMVGEFPKLAKNYSFKLTIFGDSEDDIECYEEAIFQNLSSIQQELYKEHIKSFDEAENNDDDDDDDYDDDDNEKSDKNEANKFF
jgi:hypothetical protein